MTILIGIVVVLGIGLIDYAVCRMCSIYDKWSEQQELEEWKRYVYQDDEEDDEKEN